MVDISGLLDGAEQTLFPQAVPRGATYDLDTMRMARAALLGSIGATLLAAGQGGQSPDQRAQILARLGQAPQAASEVMSAGSQNQLRAMEIAKARQETADKAARDKFFRESLSGIGAGAGGQASPAPTAAPASPPAGAATTLDPAQAGTGLQPAPVTPQSVAAANPAPPPTTAPAAVQAAVRPGGGKTWWEQLGLNPQMAAQIATLPDAQRQAVLKELIVKRATPQEVWKTQTLQDGRVIQTNSQTGEIRKALDGTPGQLDQKDIAGIEKDLRTEYLGNEAVKTYNQAQRSFLQVADLAKRANEGKPGAGVNDTALVYAFFKTIDPTSTVREGEFATVAANMGMSAQVIAALQRVDGKGFLTPETRAELVNISQGYLEKQYEDVSRLGDNYRDIAKRRNLTADNILIDPRAPEVRMRYEIKRVTPDQIMGVTDPEQIKRLPIDLMTPEQRAAVRLRYSQLVQATTGPKSVY